MKQTIKPLNDYTWNERMQLTPRELELSKIEQAKVIRDSHWIHSFGYQLLDREIKKMEQALQK